MKKIFIIVIVGLLVLSCKNENPSEQKQLGYTINGTLKNIPDSSIVYMSADNKILDSVMVIDESFKVKGRVDHPLNVYLRVKDTRDYTVFWLENEVITINAEKGKFKQAKISGSKTQAVDKILDERLSKLERQLDSIEGLYNEGMSESEIKSLAEQYNQIEQKETEIYQDFVKEYSNSIASANLLNIYATTWGKEKVSELYNGFSEEVKATRYAKEISEYIKLNNEPKLGEAFVDFEMNDVEGHSIKLSDAKGKITLLEFWASWCGPCRAENPNLVKTYETYKPKGFEIYAVSLDADKKSWLAAIEKDELPWIHVSDLNGDKNKAGLIYGVNGIPDNFLIDEAGKVIARNLIGEKLNEKLAEILP